MSPASTAEESLKPASLPTKKQQQQSSRRQPEQQQQKGRGPLIPPKNPFHGNLYTPQNQDLQPSDTEFDDFEDTFEDDGDFPEPEETYETMLSTADNVAYKNRPHAQRPQRQRTHAHKQKPLPEEYYDYLPC